MDPKRKGSRRQQETTLGASRGRIGTGPPGGGWAGTGLPLFNSSIRFQNYIRACLAVSKSYFFFLKLPLTSVPRRGHRAVRKNKLDLTDGHELILQT